MGRDLDKVIDISSTVTDWILIGIWILQQVANKSREEVIADILVQEPRTNELLTKLR